MHDHQTTASETHTIFIRARCGACGMRTANIKEWIGRSDDSRVPPRVQGRVFDRANGRCKICTLECKRGLLPVCDHIKALINGGANRESNLQLLCVPCHKVKTGADLKEKSVIARKRNKHLGITKPKRPIGSRGFARTEPQRTASRPIERRKCQ